MTWPIDKTGLIQEALSLTGDTVPNVADDGSDEWNISSAAYEAVLPYAIEGHDWKFGTKVEELSENPTAPTDPAFTRAFAKPQTLLHLIWVRLNDAPVEYQILDNQIVLSGEGTVTAKFVYAASIAAVTPTFAMALRMFVMAGIYRGLHEDNDESAKMWAAAEAILSRAKTRSDQEQPKRAMFASRLRQARRQARPWPPTPSGFHTVRR